MSSVLLVVVVLEVLGVQELDVEVELSIACARCQHVVLLLDVSSQGNASCSLSSVLVVIEELSNLRLNCSRLSSESWMCCAANSRMWK